MEAPGRGRLLAAACVAAAVALLAIVAISGAFSSDEDGDTQTTVAAPARPHGEHAATGAQPAGTPDVETIRVGGRPTSIAAGDGAVWIADPFTARGSMLEADPAAKVTRFELAGPAAAVGAGEGGVYYALQEDKAVERLDALDPGAAGDELDLGGFGSAVEVGEGSVWVLIEHSVQRLDPASGEVVDETSAGGFASGLAVDDGAVWTIADNREVVRIDVATGEVADDSPEVPDAYAVAAGEDSVWVLSATGSVTRIDPGSLAVVGRPVRVPGALALAIGEGAVWVTSARRTVTRLDPATGKQPRRAASGRRRARERQRRRGRRVGRERGRRHGDTDRSGLMSRATNSISRSTFAGAPAAITPGGRSWVTTEFAPITAAVADLDPAGHDAVDAEPAVRADPHGSAWDEALLRDRLLRVVVGDGPRRRRSSCWRTSRGRRSRSARAPPASRCG